jgi:hypothetical protein
MQAIRRQPRPAPCGRCSGREGRPGDLSRRRFRQFLLCVITRRCARRTADARPQPPAASERADRRRSQLPLSILTRSRDAKRGFQNGIVLGLGNVAETCSSTFPRQEQCPQIPNGVPRGYHPHAIAPRNASVPSRSHGHAGRSRRCRRRSPPAIRQGQPVSAESRDRSPAIARQHTISKIFAHQRVIWRRPIPAAPPFAGRQPGGRDRRVVGG